MAGFGHLAKRFIGSLSPTQLSSESWTFVGEVLSDQETLLFARMGRADQRHAVAVARRVQKALGDQPPTPVLAAAMLHDVGKTVSGLGTYGRVIATVSLGVGGHEMAEAWEQSSGFTRRVGQYGRHPELGAELLEISGSDPLVITWAREHHMPREKWTVDAEIGDVLKNADDD